MAYPDNVLRIAEKFANVHDDDIEKAATGQSETQPPDWNGRNGDNGGPDGDADHRNVA